MKMKRFVSIALCALMLLPILAGCGAKTEPTATTAAPAPNLNEGRAKVSERQALSGNSRFRNAEKTMWNDEDLDVPTYIRHQMTLDR